MKIRRVLCLLLALTAVMGLLPVHAFGVETMPVPVPVDFFGPVLEESNKDGKSCMEFFMPSFDSASLERYVQLLEKDYDMKVNHAYSIPAQGDYYVDLYSGNVNTVMMYWDMSRERMSVTVYDKFAHFVQLPEYDEDRIYVQSPEVFFDRDMDCEFDPEENEYLFEVDLGRRGMAELTAYLDMLETEYGMVLDEEESIQGEKLSVSMINDEEGDFCIAVIAEKWRGYYYVMFLFDGEQCVPLG